MKKALISIGAGPMAQCLELARPSFESFAERHGYELVIGDGATAGDRPISWGKVPLLQQALDWAEIAVWIDADAVIVDASRDMRRDLSRRHFQGLVCHHTSNGVTANCGVWMLRRHDQSRQFLREVWSSHAYIHHPWWESAAAMALLGFEFNGPPNRDGFQGGPVALRARRTSYFKRTSWLHKSWNSIVPDPADRPRIRHWAGEPQETRVEAMRLLGQHSRGH